MEDENKIEKDNCEEVVSTNFISYHPLGSLTLLGSIIAIQVHDYLKSRESKEVEA